MNSDAKRQMRTVLVVDDEPSICLLASEVLSGLDLRVLTAHDGYEALHVLKHDREHVTLALLDYSLPGMDCETLIHELQKIDRQIKVVVSTGAMGKLFENPGALGIDAMIPKPYSIRQLADLVLSLVQGDDSATETND
jgi:two-component system capsular synthesis sensor histidine kinase RcsC